MSFKIFDCITFFDNNYMFDLRYNILSKYVDYFVVCESIFDHHGNPKNKNFIYKSEYDQDMKYFFGKPFPKKIIFGKITLQREYLLGCLNFAGPVDYIFFQSDEIPKPEILKNLNKKIWNIFTEMF